MWILWIAETLNMLYPGCGIFLDSSVFSMVTFFFPATFKLHFSMSNKFGYQFITVEALSDFSRPLITKFLEF